MEYIISHIPAGYRSTFLRHNKASAQLAISDSIYLHLLDNFDALI